MSNTGKGLENFVSQIEKCFLPEDAEVITNDKVYDDDGEQLAEFDVEIRGTLGSTKVNWLIECRDRPSSGAAPGSWIEQLSGRKSRFGFNKVTAVSTTGFSASAIEAAERLNLELRTVQSLEHEDISSWFMQKEMSILGRRCVLKKAEIRIGKENDQALIDAFLSEFSELGYEEKVLITKHGDKKGTILQAYVSLIRQNEKKYEHLKPGDDPIEIAIVAQYPEGDRYSVETSKGKVEIEEILFLGEVQAVEQSVPPSKVLRYEEQADSSVISETVSFDFQLEGSDLELSLHNLGEHGTRVLLRKKE